QLNIAILFHNCYFCFLTRDMPSASKADSTAFNKSSSWKNFPLFSNN
ncbi:hypothetical protein X975_19116, partial [Stegodyphus mimosarum]